MRDNNSNGIGKKMVVILLVLLLLLGAAGGVYFFLFNKEQPYQSTFKVGISSTGASVSVTATYQLEGEETSTPLKSNSGQSSISFSGASGEKYFEAGKDIVLNSDRTFVVFTFCIKNDQLASEESIVRYLDVSLAGDMSNSGLNYYYASIENSQVWELSVKRQMIKMNNGWSQANLAPQEDIYVDILVELVDTESEVKITSSLESGLLINLIGTDRYLQDEWLLNTQNVALAYNGAETDLTVPEGVVEVNSEIFKDNSAITSIVFPSSVKLVGESAFENCTELTSVTFLNNSTSTSVSGNVSSTTQSTLGGEDDAVTIGDRAFNGCTNLNSVTLPDNIDSLSDSIFVGCSNLITVTIPGDLATVGSSVFNQSTAIEEVKFTGSQINANVASLFRPCTNLSKIVIGNTVASIANKAFKSYDSTSRKYYFTSLRSVVFEDNSQCETIGKNAFEECPIAILDFGQNSALRTVGQYAFSQTMLISVTLPEHLTTIGTSGFACPKLYEIYNLSGTSLQPGTTANGQVAKNALAVHSSLSEESIYTIQDGFVTYQDENATVLHAYLGGLKTISVPVTVNKIGSYCFYYSGITAATLPSTLTNIGKKAFENCKSLTSVVLGSTSLWAKDGDIADGIVQRTIISEDNLSQDNAANALTSTYAQNSLSKYIVVDNFAIDEDSVAFNYLGSAGIASVPNVATKLAGNLFKANCEHVYSVTIPSSVTTIVGNPFSGCTRLCEVFNLSNVNISSNVGSWVDVYTEVGESDLTIGDQYVSYAKDGENILVDYIGSSLEISVPSTFSIIGRYAFYGSKVTSITIPVEVYMIDEYAFISSSITSAVIQTNSSSTWYYMNYSSIVPSATLNSSATLASTLRSSFNMWENTHGFVVNSNRVITGYTGTDTVLTTPKRAVSIGNSALSSKTSITEITITKNIRTIGQSAFSSCTALARVNFEEGSLLDIVDYSSFSSCSALETFNFPNNVRTIGRSSFWSCTSLREVTIPASVTTMGRTAFYGCSNLKKVTISDVAKWCAIDFQESDSYSQSNPLALGADLYMDGEKVVNLVIPSGVTIIRANAFFGCNSIESVSIPASVTRIEKYAFQKCPNLQTVTLEDGTSLATIGNYAFEKSSALTSINIPSTISSIGTAAFQDCSSLTAIGLAANTPITTISERAFNNCSSLQSIIIPDSVTTMGDYAFAGCSSAATITISGNSNLSSIGSYCFQNCAKVAELNVPTRLTNIPTFAFYGCSKLATFPVLNNVTSIGDYAFYRCNSLGHLPFDENSKLTSIGNYAFIEAFSLTNLFIPRLVTSIGNYAFEACINIDGIPFADDCSIQSIGNYCFSYCYGLVDVELPDRISSLGEGAFRYCENLESINIPKSLVTLSARMFQYCSKLDQVTFADDAAVKLIDNWAFCYAGIREINIPDSVEQFGYLVFGYCDNLEYVNFGENSNLTTFAGTGDMSSWSSSTLWSCPKLKELILPSKVKDIGNLCGTGTTGMRIVVVPASLQSGSIGHTAFNNFIVGINLTNKSASDFGLSAQLLINSSGSEAVEEYSFETLDNGLVIFNYGEEKYVIGYDGTSNEVVIPEGVTNIISLRGSGAKITKLTIPSTVTSVKNTIYYLFSPYSYDNNKMAQIVNKSTVSIPGGEALVVTNDENALGPQMVDPNTGLITYAYNDEVYLVGYKGDGGDVVIPEGVTIIYENALNGNKNVTSVYIPASVKEIGSGSFYNCTNLTSVTIADNSSLTALRSYAFGNCTKLISFSFGANSIVDTLEDHCFSQAHFTSFTIPKTVTNMYRPFNNSELESVTFETGSTITTLGDSSFSNSKIKTIVLPDSITLIDRYAFSGCRYLQSVSMPAALQRISNYAFQECYSLMSITIPSGVTKIDNNAFSSCTGLYEIYNLSGLTFEIGSTDHGYIAQNAKVIHTDLSENSIFVTDGDFIYCQDGDERILVKYNGIVGTSLTIPEGITRITSTLLDLPSNSTSYLYPLLSVVLPSTLTTIDNNTFNYCNKLFEVYNLSSMELTKGQSANGYVAYYAKVIHTSMEEDPYLLRDNGFVYYISGDDVVLHHYEGNETEIVIPSYITKIGPYAFAGSNLTKLTIPATVQRISSSYTFYKSRIGQIVFEKKIGWIGADFYSTRGEYSPKPFDYNMLLDPVATSEYLSTIQSNSYDWVNRLA